MYDVLAIMCMCVYGICAYVLYIYYINFVIIPYNISFQCCCSLSTWQIFHKWFLTHHAAIMSLEEPLFITHYILFILQWCRGTF